MERTCIVGAKFTSDVHVSFLENVLSIVSIDS
jgi:hypothetical protein